LSIHHELNASRTPITNGLGSRSEVASDDALANHFGFAFCRQQPTDLHLCLQPVVEPLTVAAAEAAPLGAEVGRLGDHMSAQIQRRSAAQRISVG
jgi:hypothetical protein